MTSNLPESNPRRLEPLLLIVANVLSIGIGNAITIVLARQLSHQQFEYYIGTLATVALLASLAEAGFGKYGLKVMPVYWQNDQLGLARGYLRFSIFGCLLLSLLLGCLAAFIETAILGRSSQRVMFYALVFLPGIAGFGVMVDLLLALGRAVTATIIARLIVPLTTLAAIWIVASQTTLTPYIALLCFGLGSMLGMLLASAFVTGIAWPKLKDTSPTSHVGEWSSNGLTFLTFGFLVSWVFKAPLFLAHHLPHETNQLALLAPAMETGCWVLLLAKSTDKYFQPAMAVLIESGDWAQGAAFRRNRLQFVGVCVAVFLAFILLFGRQVLSLYGDDFTAAYPSLLIVAVGSSVWTLFSLAPSYLLFVGERRLLLKNMLLHAVILIVSTAVLFSSFGAFGAAVAYAVTISSLTLVNLRLANRSIESRKGLEIL